MGNTPMDKVRRHRANALLTTAGLSDRKAFDEAVEEDLAVLYRHTPGARIKASSLRFTSDLLDAAALIPRNRNQQMFVNMLLLHPHTPSDLLDVVTHQYLLESNLDGVGTAWKGVVVLHDTPTQFEPYRSLIQHPNLSGTSLSRLLTISGTAGYALERKNLTSSQMDEVLAACVRDVEMAVNAVEAKRTKKQALTARQLIMWNELMPWQLRNIDERTGVTETQIAAATWVMGQIATHPVLGSFGQSSAYQQKMQQKLANRKGVFHRHLTAEALSRILVARSLL